MDLEVLFSILIDLFRLLLVLFVLWPLVKDLAELFGILLIIKHLLDFTFIVLDHDFFFFLAGVEEPLSIISLVVRLLGDLNYFQA